MGRTKTGGKKGKRKKGKPLFGGCFAFLCCGRRRSSSSDGESDSDSDDGTIGNNNSSIEIGGPSTGSSPSGYGELEPQGSIEQTFLDKQKALLASGSDFSILNDEIAQAAPPFTLGDPRALNDPEIWHAYVGRLELLQRLTQRLGEFNDENLTRYAEARHRIPALQVQMRGFEALIGLLRGLCKHFAEAVAQSLREAGHDVTVSDTKDDNHWFAIVHPPSDSSSERELVIVDATWIQFLKETDGAKVEPLALVGTYAEIAEQLRALVAAGTITGTERDGLLAIYRHGLERA